MVKNLSLLRSQKHISQKALGNMVSMSQQSINAYENSEIEPDIATLAQMADILDVSIDYLVGHTDIPHRYEQVSPCDLNAAETELIELYRGLPRSVRDKFVALMKDFRDK